MGRPTTFLHIYLFSFISVPALIPPFTSFRLGQLNVTVLEWFSRPIIEGGRPRRVDASTVRLHVRAFTHTRLVAFVR